jgi:hypothetical protein
MIELHQALQPLDSTDPVNFSTRTFDSFRVNMANNPHEQE